MADFHVVIPARYQSSRLPGKPLELIGDKPMIQHVYERALAAGAKSVTVATDDERILQQVESFGQAVMTRKEHPSGSDRIYEACEKLELGNDEIVVNVQGDEPFIPVAVIQKVAALLGDKQACMSTLACPITNERELTDPNCVKVICDCNNDAIYFSRSAIPYIRDRDVNLPATTQHKYMRHLGIYAYRVGFLRQYINWPQTPLEKLEALEQLRVIENGHKIRLAVLEQATPPGVDTEQDLQAARDFYRAKQQ